MITIEPLLAVGIIPALKEFVSATKLHPILAEFTAALVPVSVFSDFIGRLLKAESLRHTGWWTLLYATVLTPFTAIAGWLFWGSDDSGVTGMNIHKWLGTGLAVLLFGLFAWRWKLRRKAQWASMAYVFVGVIYVAALAYQGYLGGQQVFSGM